MLGRLSTEPAVSNVVAHYIRKPQARLKEDQVAEIFMCRGSKQGASKVCVHYGVSEKAVRDIWTGCRSSLQIYFLTFQYKSW